MNPEEIRLYEATQKEMEELGIPRATEETAPVVEPETKEPEKEPETKEDDETKQVPVKEVIDPKEYKDFKTKLREELQADFDQKLEKLKEEMAKEKPSETKSDNLEEEARELAKELEFDEAKTLALLKSARKGVELSPEDKQALEEFKSQKAEREERVQQESDTQEWNSLPIKNQFPNATEEQFALAKETMLELAHSDKYADKEMDYILYKEKETFDKILFSPKMKTFESGRKTQEANDDDGEFPTFRPDMTPAEFESFEKKRNAFMSKAPREKVLQRTTDDAGKAVERWI